MLLQLGIASLALAFFAAVYGVFAFVIAKIKGSDAWRASGKQACLILFPLLTLATGTLLGFLLQRNYQMESVYQTVDNTQSTLLRIAALWGKQSGSLLFWSWFFAFFLFLWTLRNADDALFPTAAIFLLLNLGFFIGLNLWAENPFKRLWLDINTQQIFHSIAPINGTIAYFPENGLGMNPLLRHFGMILHPPALYLGYIGIYIPTAWQLSAMIHHPKEFDWIAKTRSWNLFAWVFLAIGLILGSRWAYDVLGWGGYWGWDPVEVSALIPFLLLTAYLHAAVGYSRTGKYKGWATVTGLLSGLSIVFSTFVTRSGLISSIHAFSVSPVSTFLLVYLLLFFFLAIGLCLSNRKALRDPDPSRPLPFRQEMQTRGFLFTLMMSVLLLIAFFCLWGILLPNLSALVSGTTLAVDASYYAHATGPLFLLILFLIGLYPLTRWGQPLRQSATRALLACAAAALLLTGWICVNHSVRPFLRMLTIWVICFALLVFLYDWIRHAFVVKPEGRAFQPQKWLTQFTASPARFASRLIHLGVLLMAVGIVGIEFFQSEGQFSLSQDETKPFNGIAFTLENVRTETLAEGSQTTATLLGSLPNGETFTLQPGRKFFSAYNQETTLPGIHSSLARDVYAVLMSSQSAAAESSPLFTFFENPLINWLWIGSFLLCLGGILLFCGSFRKKNHD